MLHSAVWGYLSYQKQNTNSKTLMIEKLSESGLQRHTNFDRARWNHQHGFALNVGF